MTNPFKNNRILVIAWLLGLLSLLLRGALISRGPFNVDALNLAIKAETTLTTGRPLFLFGTGYPLTVLLGAVFVGLGRLFAVPDPVLAVNMMSVVLSAATISLCFLWVVRVLEPRTAFFSAVLLSLFPIYLGLSTFGMSHIPSLFFLFSGLLALTATPGALTISRFFWASVCFGAMGACRLQDLIFFAPALTFLLIRKPDGSENKSGTSWPLSRIGFFWAGAGTTFLLFHLPLVLNSADTGYLPQLFRYWRVSSGQNFLGLFSPSLTDSLSWFIFGLTPVGCLAAFWGLAGLWKEDRHLWFFLLLWLLVPLLTAGNLAMTAPRFLLIAVPPFVIAAGAGFTRLSLVPKKSFPVASAIVFLMIVLTLFGNMYPILSFRHRHALLPDFARYVKQVTAADALVIAGDEGLFIRYYGHRDLLSRPRSGYQLLASELREFDLRLTDLLARGVPVYITSSGLRSYDPDKAFSRFMKQAFRLEYIGERWSEDWHQGSTRLRVGKEKLYRVFPRQRRQDAKARQRE